MLDRCRTRHTPRPKPFEERVPADLLLAAGRVVFDLAVIEPTERGKPWRLTWRSEFAPRGARVEGASYEAALRRLIAEEHRRRESGCVSERAACGE